MAEQQSDSRKSQRFLRLIGGRFVQALITLLGASLLIWAILPLAPGDPAMRALQTRGVREPLPAQIEAERIALGLDKPLVVQYQRWLLRVVRGDLSHSYQSGKPVLEEFAKRLPATLLLGGTALLIALALSLLAALIAASNHERWPDQVIRLLTQISVTVPSFLLGLLLLNFVVLGLGWGRVLSNGNASEVWLPAICLAIGRAGDWTQLLRANLLETLGSRYALLTSARGATQLRVLLRYALPNALLPFLTAVGVGVGVLIGGAAIIETVFSWPGLGSYVVAAVNARDFPVIQGFVIISTLTYITVSFVVDLAAALLDPRVREGNGQ